MILNGAPSSPMNMGLWQIWTRRPDWLQGGGGGLPFLLARNVDNSFGKGSGSAHAVRLLFQSAAQIQSLLWPHERRRLAVHFFQPICLPSWRPSVC